MSGCVSMGYPTGRWDVAQRRPSTGVVPQPLGEPGGFAIDTPLWPGPRTDAYRGQRRVSVTVADCASGPASIGRAAVWASSARSCISAQRHGAGGERLRLSAAPCAASASTSPRRESRTTRALRCGDAHDPTCRWGWRLRCAQRRQGGCLFGGAPRARRSNCEERIAMFKSVSSVPMIHPRAASGDRGCRDRQLAGGKLHIVTPMTQGRAHRRPPGRVRELATSTGRRPLGGLAEDRAQARPRPIVHAARVGPRRSSGRRAGGRRLIVVGNKG